MSAGVEVSPGWVEVQVAEVGSQPAGQVDLDDGVVVGGDEEAGVGGGGGVGQGEVGPD